MLMHMLKTQKMCNKFADTSPSAIQFALECYNTHEMCDKAVDACALTFGSRSIEDSRNVLKFFPNNSFS